MDFITFDLIGRLTVFVIIAFLVVRVLWWCFDTLPIKIIDVFLGWKYVLRYFQYRKEIDKWLEQNKK